LANARHPEDPDASDDVFRSPDEVDEVDEADEANEVDEMDGVFPVRL